MSVAVVDDNGGTVDVNGGIAVDGESGGVVVVDAVIVEEVGVVI